MHKKVLVFCHGFGFNCNFWSKIKKYFRMYRCIYINLGYFKDTQDNCSIDIKSLAQELEAFKGYNIIGIGHSLGFMKLVNSNIKFSTLIGLNAFINFIGNKQNTQNRRIDEFNSFRKIISKSPRLGLIEFYKRSLVFDFSPQNIKLLNHNRIQQDLVDLCDICILPNTIPMLIIGANDDTIVPPETLHSNFLGIKNVKLEITQGGGHGLGYNKPKFIADKIKTFIEHN